MADKNDPGESGNRDDAEKQAHQDAEASSGAGESAGTKGWATPPGLIGVPEAAKGFF
ncbi:hypothetical protein [Rothia halotolerans]|uniref:hypothetical protein n=1 Tax=Rothia halotolerans TaxID=405770 RepID=UPI0013EB75CC|nr:hypothetical protein [Rothia halotolerans]